MEVVSHCCSDSRKQEGLRLLYFGASDRTDRGAIRPCGSRSVLVYPKILSAAIKSLPEAHGLNTPLFLHTLHRSSMCKKF